MSVAEGTCCCGVCAAPVHELARLIASGGAFVDEDAVRVAREYLAVTGVRLES